MITLPRIAERRLEHRAFFLQPSASGTIVAASPEGRVTVLAPELEILSRFDVGREPSDVAISPAGDLIAICAGESLTVNRSSDGGESFRVKVGPGCASWFGDDGSLIWTLTAEGEKTIAVHVRDACDGRVLRESRFAGPSRELRCSFHTHPRPGGVTIWAAAGQDGQWLFFAHDDGAAITVTQAKGIDECNLPTFDAAGSAFLITAWNSLSRWSLTGLTRTAELDEWPWSETEDDCVGESVAWAGARRALVATNENRLYLVDLDEGAVVDEAVIEGPPLRPIGEIFPTLDKETGATTDLGFFVPLGTSRILSVHGDLDASSLVLSDTTSLHRPSA
jgi:hypothetical protein